MNDRGRGGGLALLVILLAALVAALLMARQMRSLDMGVTSSDGTSLDGTSQRQDAVERAQGAVDAINSRIQAETEALG